MHRVGLPQRAPADGEGMRREKGAACLEMAAATASYGASCVCVEERLGRGAGMAVKVAQDSVRPA